MIIQHWLIYWLGVDVGPNLRHHRGSLGHNEFMYTYSTWTWSSPTDVLAPLGAKPSVGSVNTLRLRQHFQVQTTFSSAFSWMKTNEFQTKFHCSLFIRVHLTIFQHWFADLATSHYLNQWLDDRHVHASLGVNHKIWRKLPSFLGYQWFWIYLRWSGDIFQDGQQNLSKHCDTASAKNSHI